MTTGFVRGALFVRLGYLDGVGPARFADLRELPLVNPASLGIREVPAMPLGGP